MDFGATMIALSAILFTNPAGTGSIDVQQAAYVAQQASDAQEAIKGQLVCSEEFETSYLLYTQRADIIKLESIVGLLCMRGNYFCHHLREIKNNCNEITQKIGKATKNLPEYNDSFFIYLNPHKQVIQNLQKKISIEIENLKKNNKFSLEVEKKLFPNFTKLGNLLTEASNNINIVKIDNLELIALLQDLSKNFYQTSECFSDAVHAQSEMIISMEKTSHWLGTLYDGLDMSILNEFEIDDEKDPVLDFIVEERRKTQHAAGISMTLSELLERHKDA